MLYERWLRVAGEFRRERAVVDGATGREWCFGELADEADRSEAPADRVVYPSGGGVDFVREVLRGWRHGCVVCPLERGQGAPALGGFPNEWAHVKSTSATTGRARWVVFTGEQLAADARNIVVTMGLRRDWPNLSALSLAHSYGFSNVVLPLLLYGIPAVLLANAFPETVRRATREVGLWTVPAAPAIWRTWFEAGVVCDSMRLAISAGAPLPLGLESEVFAKIGVKIHNFLGSTECGGIAFDRGGGVREDEALAGSGMSGVELAVDDEGCLVVRGAAVGESYWPEPSEGLGNGEFRTSDLAEIRGGQVWLRGRKSDWINVAGRKLDPGAVESVLGTYPGVRECLVLGMPGADAARGETPEAVVVAGESVTPLELRKFLSGRLDEWKIPRRWHFVEGPLANARGKVSRAEWRRKLGELRGERELS